jgi:glycerol-3-phosphate dehydrogenase
MPEAPCDVLIVGGGIHGLFAAYDAARRGLRVAVVDRGDVGGEASFNHQRTLHGGLRALQSGHLQKCRAQIHERRTWARIAPALVRPLPFLLGTYRGTARSRLLVRTGFTLYDLVGRHRNAGVMPELHLPKCRLESAAVTRRLFPDIPDAGLSGGAVWYDYQTVHPDRLTWCVARAALAAGASIYPYTAVTGVHVEQGHVTGLAVVDVIAGTARDLPARQVVCAAGAGLAGLHALAGATGAPPLVRAMNLLLSRPARDIALAGASSSGRMYTAVPWQGHTLVGTFTPPGAVAGDDATPPDVFVDAFLAEVNTAFPALRASRRDVRFVHHGLVPGVIRGDRADFLPEPLVIRHTTPRGLFSLVGVKYTTARAAAAALVDALDGVSGGATTDRHVLPHADVADAEGLVLEALRAAGQSADRDVVAHLAGWYGTEAPAVVAEAVSTSDGLERVCREMPVTCGELRYVTRTHLVTRLADAVFRRTPLASSGSPGDAALTRAADIVGEVLGWSPTRKAEERALVGGRLPA